MMLMATPPVYPAIGSWSSVGIALIDVFTDPNTSVSFPSTGSVQMIWTVFNGACGQASDTAVITVEDCVIGMMENASDALPSLTFESVSSSVLWKDAGDDAALEVFDRNGRRLLSKRSLASNGRVPLQGIAPGVYLAHLTSHGRAEALRFVVAPITNR
jgi:hypothetical protein